MNWSHCSSVLLEFYHRSLSVFLILSQLSFINIVSCLCFKMFSLSEYAISDFKLFLPWLNTWSFQLIDGINVLLDVVVFELGLFFKNDVQRRIRFWSKPIFYQSLMNRWGSLCSWSVDNALHSKVKRVLQWDVSMGHIFWSITSDSSHEVLALNFLAHSKVYVGWRVSLGEQLLWSIQIWSMVWTKLSKIS